MAVPHIAHISPARGPAFGGNIISINGADFNIAYGTYPIETVPVAVTFNGRAANKVYVISANQIWAEAPGYLGAPAAAAFSPVDIAVSNLDSGGIAVPGETVTKIGIYTYERVAMLSATADIVKRSPSEQIVYAMLARLMREVTTHVGLHAHVDFGEVGATEVARKECPCIEVRVRQLRDHEFGQWDNEKQKKLRVGGDGYDVYRPAKSWMFTFDLTLVDTNEIVVLRLMDAVRECQESYPYLRVAGDPEWAPAGENKFPLELSEGFSQVSNPSNIPLVAFSTQLRVRGVRIMPSNPPWFAPIYRTITLTTSQNLTSVMIPV